MYVKDPVKVSMAIQRKSEHRRQRKIHDNINGGFQEKIVKGKDTHFTNKYKKEHNTDLECRWFMVCHKHPHPLQSMNRHCVLNANKR
jgi:hypothetical protein